MYKNIGDASGICFCLQFFDRVLDDHAVWGSSPSSGVFLFFIHLLFSLLFVFLLIPNSIFVQNGKRSY